jgi:hypothetical protein
MVYIIWNCDVDDDCRQRIDSSEAEEDHEREHAKSIDQTINSLIDTSEGIPSSMLGADKQARVRLTRREHEELQG